jgi:hypothetical protein
LAIELGLEFDLPASLEHFWQKEKEKRKKKRRKNISLTQKSVKILPGRGNLGQGTLKEKK